MTTRRLVPALSLLVLSALGCPPRPTPRSLPLQRYVFVANRTDGTIGAYSVNPRTHLPIPRAYAFAGGATPMALLVSGSNLFVALGGTAGVAQFGIEPSGHLTLLGTAMAGTNPSALAMSNNVLYVANRTSSNVSVFTLAAGTGLLQLVETIAAGTGPSALAVDRSGKFLFVANQVSNSVSEFSIDPTTGTLQPAGPVTVGASPVALAAGPGVLYVANASDGTVSSLTIDPVTGKLARQDLNAGAPGVQDLPVGVAPSALVVSNDDRFVWAGRTGGIVTLGAGAGGLLQAGNVAAGVSNTGGMALDPTGQWLTVTDGPQNEVVTMKVDVANGNLTMVGSGHARGLPVSVAISTGLTPWGSTPRVVLAGGDGEQDLRSYVVDSNTGALTSTGTAGTNYAQSIAIHPRLPVAYAVGSGPVMQKLIERFTLDLTAGSAALATPTVASGGLPVAVVVEPSGRFAYVVHESKNSADLIWTLSVDQSTGALTKLPGQTWNPGISPAAAAVDPTGKYFYVLNKTTSDIAAYQINPNTGALTPLASPTFPAGVTGPTSIAIHTSGHALIVSNGTAMGTHTIDRVTGALGPFVATIIGAFTSVAVYPSGEYAVGAGGSTGFESITLNPVTGVFAGPGSPKPSLAGFTGAATAPDLSGRWAWSVEFTLNPAPDGKVVPFTTDPATGYVMTATAGTAVAGPLGGRAVVVKGTAW